MKAFLDLIRRETLVHFAIAGAVLFAIDAARTRPEAEAIVVTPAAIDGLMQGREELLGRPVSPDERPTVIARHVNDEILLREAYARELYRHDGIVRKRLLELMRFLLVDEPSEPTEHDLRVYLEEHRSMYQTSGAVTFSHVFYAAGENAKTPEAADLLPQLRAGRNFRSFGEPFWLGRVLEGYPEPQLARLLGSGFAQKVIGLPLHEWSGPIDSTRGIHFIRLDERRPPEVPEFSELLPTLRADWLAAKREERLMAKVEELRDRYRVTIEAGTR